MVGNCSTRLVLPWDSYNVVAGESDLNKFVQSICLLGRKWPLMRSLKSLLYLRGNNGYLRAARGRGNCPEWN
jgi:hypothetical protein